MREAKKMLKTMTVALLFFTCVLGAFSIKAEAAKGPTEAEAIDGVYLYPSVKRVAIEKDGVTLDGYDLSGYNVYIRANNVTVKNCKNITYIKLASNYKYITVSGNTVVGSTADGIIIESGVTESNIKKNTITGTTLTGINANGAEKCVIDGNTIKNNGKNNTSQATHSIYIKSCIGMTISNNTVTDSAHYGITLNGDNASTVKNNTIKNCCVGNLNKDHHGDGLLLDQGCKKTQVLDNTIDGVKSGIADYGNGLIVGRNSEDVVVKNNKISNAGNHGMQVTYFSKNITVSGNEITKSGNDGLSVSRDSQAKSTNNKIHDNTGHGIVYDGHEHKDGETYVNGFILSNDVYSNTEIGIFIQDSNVTISENTVKNNGSSGIRIENSGTVKIEKNTLGDNGSITGLHLLGTSVNTVSENYIYKSNPDQNVIGIRVEGNAQATIIKNRIANYAEAAVFAGTSAKVTLQGNQASVAGTGGFKEYYYAYFLSESPNSDTTVHNTLYLKELTNSSVKGLTHYNGYTSGAVVNGATYLTQSAPVEDGVNILVKFPSQSGTDKIILFTTDNKGNSICLNAPIDFVLQNGSDEAQVKAFVKRFYKEVLGREGEADGINDWTQKLVSKERTGADVAKGFAMSTEFKNRNLNDDQFIKTMYKGFFDREPDQDGYDGWIKKINEGYSREYVLAGFVNSQEFRNLCAKYGINPGSLTVDNPTPTPQPQPQPQPSTAPLKLDASGVSDAKLNEYVERLYKKALGRDSDAEGKTYWFNTIKSGKDPNGNVYDAATAARVGFFESKEYKLKGRNDDEFLTDLYWAFFDREPDADGYAYWQNKMKNEGYTRQRVIDEGFGHSKEFKNLLESYGFKIIQ